MAKHVSDKDSESETRGAVAPSKPDGILEVWFRLQRACLEDMNGRLETRAESWMVVAFVWLSSGTSADGYYPDTRIVMALACP